jgi:hypothetical protein
MAEITLNIYGSRKIYLVFWWENLKERCHLGYLGMDGRIV